LVLEFLVVFHYLLVMVPYKDFVAFDMFSNDIPFLIAWKVIEAGVFDQLRH
jgi:hypothetical protein